MPFVRRDEAKEYPLDGMRAIGISAPRTGAAELTTAVVEFQPERGIAPHTHDHEEVLFVVSGRLRLTLGDDEAVLEPGDAALIPAGTRHHPRADGSEGARFVSTTVVGTLRIQEDGTSALPPWGD